MQETEVYIINRSLVVCVSEPHGTGGHGYGPFSERSITFIGEQEPSPNSLKITMAPSNLREEIFEVYKELLGASITQDI